MESSDWVSRRFVNTDFKLNSVQNWAWLTAISAELQLINIALIKILSCRGELFELWLVDVWVLKGSHCVPKIKKLHVVTVQSTLIIVNRFADEFGKVDLLRSLSCQVLIYCMFFMFQQLQDSKKNLMLFKLIGIFYILEREREIKTLQERLKVLVVRNKNILKELQELKQSQVIMQKLAVLQKEEQCQIEKTTCDLWDVPALFYQQ